MAGKGTVAEDLSGRVFGRWAVQSRAGQTSTKRATWHCKCSCGTEKVVEGINLRNGLSKSCGCLRREPYAKTHGQSAKSTRAYMAWKRLRSRCDNPNIEAFAHYGGRGITYDPRWKSFENFYADMGEPAAGLWLDRIDNDGNYSKENCRWATPSMQRRNRSDPMHWVDINGERLVLIDAVKKYGAVSYGAALMRIGRGWSDVDAILTPKNGTPKGTE